MSKLERTFTVIAGLALPAGLVMSAAVGKWGILVTGAVALAAWRFVPGFWRMLGTGLMTGAIVGGLILGPGFRLTMRVIAIFDIRRVEFTLEGTLFIIVGIGVIFGGAIGMMAALLRRGLGWSGPIMAGMMTVGVLALLLADTGLRSELVDLGAGPWMNIPMFAAVSFAYGLYANRLIDRFEAKITLRAALEPVEVPT